MYSTPYVYRPDEISEVVGRTRSTISCYPFTFGTALSAADQYHSNVGGTCNDLSKRSNFLIEFPSVQCCYTWRCLELFYALRLHLSQSLSQCSYGLQVYIHLCTTLIPNHYHTLNIFPCTASVPGHVVVFHRGRHSKCHLFLASWLCKPNITLQKLQNSSFQLWSIIIPEIALKQLVTMLSAVCICQILLELGKPIRFNNEWSDVKRPAMVCNATEAAAHMAGKLGHFNDYTIFQQLAFYCIQICESRYPQRLGLHSSTGCGLASNIHKFSWHLVLASFKRSPYGLV